MTAWKGLTYTTESASALTGPTFTPQSGDWGYFCFLYAVAGTLGGATWHGATMTRVTPNESRRAHVFKVANPASAGDLETSDSAPGNNNVITFAFVCGADAEVIQFVEATDSGSEYNVTYPVATVAGNAVLVAVGVHGSGAQNPANAGLSNWRLNGSPSGITEAFTAGDGGPGDDIQGGLAYDMDGATGASGDDWAVAIATGNYPSFGYAFELGSTGAAVIDGAAALAGIGTLTATGEAVRNGAAALAGAGTLTAGGLVDHVGAAVLVGIGTLTATGEVVAAPIHDGAAALVGVGSLTGAGVRRRVGTAALVGRGKLVAIADVPDPYTPTGPFRAADFRVEIGVGSGFGGGDDLYDVAEYNDPDATYGGTDPTYVDVSAFARRIRTRTGKQFWSQRFRAGAASILLNAESGLFHAESGSPGPGGNVMQPNRALRVSVTWGAGWVPIFTGHVWSITHVYDDAGYRVAAVLDAFDSFEYFANHDDPALPSAVGAGELSGARIGRILDAAEWSDDRRDVDAGDHTLAATTLAQPSLDLLHITAESEGGALFMSPDDVVIFRDRDWLSEDARATASQVTFGRIGAGDDLDVVGTVEDDHSTTRIFNDIQYARAGGTLQRSQDAVSRSQFGPRTYRRLDLINDNDSDVATLSARALAWSKDNRTRLETLTVAPLRSPATAIAAGLAIGDLVTANVYAGDHFAYSVDAHVFGIAWFADADSGDWSATFNVDDAAAIGG